MKAVGIIAEYNPFHNGHAYQLAQAKKLSGADYVIVAMSGNYVQRGTPAVIDKFSRAAMALKNGADLVFELPVLWSTASAEYFAAAGIALFDRLGVVDTLSFGCETPDTALLTEIAQVLATEPGDYSRLLASFLRQGASFPLARKKALLSLLTTVPFAKNDRTEAALAEVLNSPNNILALEYQKSLIRRNSKIRALPILRQGAGYHEKELHSEYSSATSLRKLLLQNKAVPEELRNILPLHVPKDVADFLSSPETVFTDMQDFSDMLYYKLLSERENGFSCYADVPEFLSNRIANTLDAYLDCIDFCSRIKSRDITYTRVRRALLHILLNIRTFDYETGIASDYIPYLRPLGFRRSASGLFSEITKRTCCPILTKPARAASLLSPEALSLYRLDLFASNLYYGRMGQKSRFLPKNEYQRELIILP